MKTSIELIVHIQGENLYECCDGLTKVAGDALVARILNKGNVVHTHTAEVPSGLHIKKPEVKNE